MSGAQPAEALDKSGRVAAFFDMDRTLVHANTGTLWIRWLYRRGELSRWKMLRALGWIAQYKLSVIDMEAVIEIANADLAGQSEAEMIDKCLEFTERLVLPAITDRARAALDEHRRAGHELAILSTSTPYVTEPLARSLGIEHVLCTRLEVQGGRFVGKHIRPACYGEGKVHYAEAFARARRIDLGRSYFYTDSYSDLPMLERVGEARVVNPDARLRRHARRVGWRVDEW
jgi:HAD superfamily hydrolase (TIGR01490 family)